MLQTSPPQIATLSKAIKVTVDGPREPRSKTSECYTVLPAVGNSTLKREQNFYIFWYKYAFVHILFAIFFNQFTLLSSKTKQKKNKEWLLGWKFQYLLKNTWKMKFNNLIQTTLIRDKKRKRKMHANLQYTPHKFTFRFRTPGVSSLPLWTETIPFWSSSGSSGIQVVR